ncbi:MAG: AAA family ATPase [Chitinispirillia bacterium]|nr:AAA family ATPase [Chitinispirillia bacterium]
MGNCGTALNNLINASVNVIQIVSYETLRIHAMLIRSARELERGLYIWNRVEGLKKWNNDKGAFDEEDAEMRNGDAIFRFYDEHENVILLLEDFFPDLTEHNPENIRRVRNAALKDSANRTLILSQPHRALPFELEKEVHVLELPYPDLADIKAIYKKVCSKYNIKNAGDPDQELLEAALGLTIMEAEKAFSLAYIDSGSLSRSEVPRVIMEKESVIKKSGYLEYYHPKETIDDVGGLNNLKEWLKKRGRGFDKGAEDFGLTSPRGILLLGIPGTGKSLTAKAIGNLWHYPLLRLDMGKIFGGIVGQSESNIRGALNIVETIAPSILWIDEIEKAMSGMSSSGSTDGGTTARVLGTFLTWMQEKSKPVFVVATANDVSKLPPELLRKGRVDEIFFVDLPTQKEREMIISIHLKRKKRDPKKFNIRELAQKSCGFSGAELEEVVKEALFSAFDKSREIRDDDIIEAIDKTFPLSRTMHETIDKLRLWAKSRAVSASAEEPELLDAEKDKDIPKLKQESYNNPFIG